MQAADVPDLIDAVPDSITAEAIACGECGRPYRVVPAELQLLRRFGLPVPRSCFNCRHLARVRRMNPPRLWGRNCAKCGAGIETSYSPDRPEIVYCESCYQQEVA